MVRERRKKGWRKGLNGISVLDKGYGGMVSKWLKDTPLLSDSEISRRLKERFGEEITQPTISAFRRNFLNGGRKGDFEDEEVDSMVKTQERREELEEELGEISGVKSLETVEDYEEIIEELTGRITALKIRQMGLEEVGEFNTSIEQSITGNFARIQALKDAIFKINGREEIQKLIEARAGDVAEEAVRTFMPFVQKGRKKEALENWKVCLKRLGFSGEESEGKRNQTSKDELELREN